MSFLGFEVLRKVAFLFAAICASILHYTLWKTTWWNCLEDRVSSDIQERMIWPRQQRVLDVQSAGGLRSEDGWFEGVTRSLWRLFNDNIQGLGHAHARGTCPELYSLWGNASSGDELYSCLGIEEFWILHMWSANGEHLYFVVSQ